MAVALLLPSTPAWAQAPALPTPYPTPAEEADYLSFTAPEEVGPYLGRLAANAEGVSLDSLAATSPIPIVRIAPMASVGDQSETSDRGSADRDSVAPGPGSPIVRVLVIGAQHGNERAGVEVGLRLARDLVAGRLAGLRGSLDVRIVPMANPWGVANRRLETAEGVDMNADHVRLAAPETRALWAEYAAWRPHLVLDLHELGPSEYTVQVSVPTHPNAPAAGRFARFYLLPFVANELAGSDIRFHEYVAEWTDGRTGEGAAAPGAGAAAWFTPPPLDPSSARNAFALAGSVAYFIAVSSSRDIVGLEERTERLYIAVSSLLTAAAGRAPDLAAAHEAARRLPKDALALRSRYVAKGPDASVPWIFINSRGQRERGRLAPWRSEVAVDLELEPPVGWWLAPDQRELAEVLRAHGFEVEGAETGAVPLGYPDCVPADIDTGTEIGTGTPAEASRFLRPAPDARVEGALWVDADQPGGRLLFTLIEPWSVGGWFDAGSGEGPGAGFGEERDAGDAVAGELGVGRPEACDEAAPFPVVRVPR